MKTFAIVADFPEVLAKHHIQAVTVKAGAFGLAAKRGLDAIRKRDGIKGMRISKVKLSIVVVDEKLEQDAGQ